MTLLRWPWQADSYVSIKITNCSEHDCEPAKQEFSACKHIINVQSNHSGCCYVRLAKDSFTTEGSHGEYLCLILKSMQQLISTFTDILAARIYLQTSLELFFPLFLRLLASFTLIVTLFIPASTDWYTLHSIICYWFIIDLKSNNFMVPFKSTVVINDYICNLELEPPVYKMCEGRSVYILRSDFGALRKSVRFV